MNTWSRWAILFLLFASAGNASAQDLLIDFRNKKVDENSLRFEGPDFADYVKLEDEGLRWHYTGGISPGKAIGVRWNTNIKGDFTATVHYEILKVGRPASGNGVGIEMWVQLDTPPPMRDAIAFNQVMHPNFGSVFAFFYMTNSEDGRRISKFHAREKTTTASKFGKLRLMREGKVLTAWGAEGDQDFVPVGPPREIGDMDVLLVRIAGFDGGVKNAELDLRLLEFSLKGAALGVEKKDAFAPPPAPTDLISETGSGRWLFWVLAIVGVLALTFFLVVGLLVGLTRSRAKTASEADASSKVMFCASCGTRVKIKPDVAGKNVKCPNCGKLTRVPEQ